MERIVFLDRSTLVAEVRRPEFEHEWAEYPMSSQAEVVERLAQATIVITNKVPLREAELSRLPELKLIAVAATGVDIIDLNYCRRRNLPVSNVRNYARRAVPEHVFMLILALRRNLLNYRYDLERGAWQKATGFCLLDHTIRDLHGSTLGLIGHGALGKAVEELAVALVCESALDTSMLETCVRENEFEVFARNPLSVSMSSMMRRAFLRARPEINMMQATPPINTAGVDWS